MSDEIVDAVTGTVSDLFGDVEEDTTFGDDASIVDEMPEEEAWSFDPGNLYDEEEPAAIEEDAEPEIVEADPDEDTVARLERELDAAKKRAEFHERRYTTSAREKWEADVRSQPWGQFLPDDLSAVTATSHRDYLRQVRQLAKTNYESLKPHLERLAAERERLTAIATAEARAEVQAAWGRPTVGSGQIPVSPSQAADDALQKARQNRNLSGAVKALIDGGVL